MKPCSGFWGILCKHGRACLVRGSHFDVILCGGGIATHLGSADRWPHIENLAQSGTLEIREFEIELILVPVLVSRRLDAEDSEQPHSTNLRCVGCRRNETSYTKNIIFREGKRMMGWKIVDNKNRTRRDRYCTSAEAPPRAKTCRDRLALRLHLWE